MNVTEAHAALDTLVSGAGIRVADPGAGDPPYAFAFMDGADLEHLLRGVIVQRFRVSLVSGAWEERATSDVLGQLVMTVVDAVRSDQTGWLLREVRPATRMPLAGGTFLACDVVVAHAVDIATTPV